jgi:hypothetical protein
MRQNQELASVFERRLAAPSSPPAKQARTADDRAAELTVVLSESLALPPMPNATLVVGTGLSPEQNIIFQRLAAYANVQVDLTTKTTHVVTNATPGQPAKRTFKYLSGILRGLWVLSFDWVEACLAAGALVAEEPFWVTSNLRQEHAPGPQRARQAHQAPDFVPLFDGHAFALPKSDVPSQIPRSELKNLIALGGGRIVTRSANISGCPPPHQPEAVWIIDCPFHEGEESPLPPRHLTSGQLLASIATYSFPEL